MPDMSFTIVERARRRTAQVRLGDVPTSLQEGPKWVCHIVPNNEAQKDVGAISPARVSATFGSLRPANISLTNSVEHEGSWFASSAHDESGRCRAYAHLGVDRTLEMVGMPGVGPWLDERDTWWPGAYELPLLEQLPTIVTPLLDLGDETGSAHLLMSLTAIDGTALVTESDDGIERPFRIPEGVDTVHFAPVCIGGPTVLWRGALIAAFDRVRHLVGLKSTRPFYL
jgi:hypothetical protein